MGNKYVLLIRHGETAGNREKRYVGTTDEDLTPEAVQALTRLRKERLPGFFRTCFGGNAAGQITLYISPLRRCRETASILFPGVSAAEVEDFREMNFGQFEYRNYRELNGNRDYQAYIDSGGEAAFPGGESKEVFCGRVVRAAEPLIFRKKTKNGPDENEMVAIVAHGGTIMAIMDRFSDPHEDYFSWQLPPGGMLLTRAEKRSLKIVER